MSLRYRPVKKITRKVKERILEELVQNLKNYKFLMVADLFKIRSSELQQIRLLLRPFAKLKCTRNRIMEKALEKVYGTKILNLTGSNLFIFTNKNPYELSLFLSKNKIPIPAQPEAIAPKDIIIPEGNTGLTPGPILSKFSKLKVPTRIVEGSVWVAKDTVIVKQGEKISKEAVELLNLLGIKPLELSLNLKMAFDGKTVLEKLSLDLEEITSQLKKAVEDTFKLSIQARLPIRETIPILIQQAYLDYLKISESLVLPEKGILEKNIQKAETLARALYERIKDKIKD